MTIGTVTYGRFTHEEWAKLTGPYFERDGAMHKLTDFHQTPSDVRYQAVEVDPAEREEWEHKQAHARATWEEAKRERGDAQPEQELAPRDDEDGGREATFEEERAHEAVIQEEDHIAEALREEQLAARQSREEPDETVPDRTPTLQEFARHRGWRRGPISARIKEQYRNEVGNVE